MIIDALRADGALALSLVAEVDGEVVGHVAYSAADVGEPAPGVGDAPSGWFLVGPSRGAPGVPRPGDRAGFDRGES